MSVAFARLRGVPAELSRVQDNIGAVLDPVAAKLAQSTVWQPLTLVNGWVPYDATTFNAPQYRVDMEGFVHARGLIKSGTVSFTVACATFPASVAPVRTNIFAIASQDAFGEARVDPSGNIYIVAGVNTWASLDGLTWQAGA